MADARSMVLAAGSDPLSHTVSTFIKYSNTADPKKMPEFRRLLILKYYLKLKMEYL